MVHPNMTRGIPSDENLRWRRACERSSRKLLELILNDPVRIRWEIAARAGVEPETIRNYEFRHSQEKAEHWVVLFNEPGGTKTRVGTSSDPSKAIRAAYRHASRQVRA